MIDCASAVTNDRLSCRCNRAMLADKAAGAALAQMARRGVIARAMPQGDIICRAPPLCLTLEEADTSAKALKTVLG